MARKIVDETVVDSSASVIDAVNPVVDAQLELEGTDAQVEEEPPAQIKPFTINGVAILDLVNENPLQVFEFLPEELICDPVKNGRSSYVKADRSDLRKKIKSEGRILSPVLFKIDTNGLPYLTVGYGRYEVAAEIDKGKQPGDEGFIYIPAIYDAKKSQEGEEDQDTFFTNLSENLGRKDLSPIDKLHIIMRMKKSKEEGGFGMKQSAIARETGWTEAYVSYIANLAKVTNKKHIEAIHKGIVGYKEAIEYASKIKDPNKMAAAFDTAIERYDLADEDEAGKKKRKSAQDAIAEAQADRGLNAARTTKQARIGIESAKELASLNARTVAILGVVDDYLSGKIKTEKNFVAKLETAGGVAVKAAGKAKAA